MLDFKVAKPRDVGSLRNWVDGNACLSWEETDYLAHDKDLLSVASLEDNAVARLEAWVEDAFVRFFNGFRTVGLLFSRSTNVD